MSRDKCTVRKDELNCINGLSKRDRQAASHALLQYLIFGEAPEGLSEKAADVFAVVSRSAEGRAIHSDRQKSRAKLQGKNAEQNCTAKMHCKTDGQKEKEKAPPSAPVPPVSSLSPEPPITPLNPFIPSIPLKEKENRARTRKDPWLEFANGDEALEEALEDFRKHRRAFKNAPFTDKAQSLTLAKLEKLSGGDHLKMIRILEQSIERGWRGVFALDEDKKSEANTNWFAVIAEEEARKAYG